MRDRVVDVLSYKDALSALNIASRMFSTKPVRIAALFYLILSVICTQVPLLNYLGYEFSVVVALFASVISGVLAILLTASVQRSDESVPDVPLKRLKAAFLQSLGVNLALLAIPLAVITGNALFVKNCSLLQGGGFYLLVPCFSVLCGTTVGTFCAVVFRMAKTWFVVILASTFIYSLVLGYFTPAIFSYNLFYGYFPGFTYDELLELNWTLVLYRLFTLFVCILVLAGTILVAAYSTPPDPAWRKLSRLLQELVVPRRILLTAAAAVVLALVVAFRCELGFESTSSYIRGVLGSEYRTDHFTIVYSAKSYSDEEIRWIAAEHEFRLHQILDELALTRQARITSFVYPSMQVKRRLMGAGATDIAKPWSAEIHISKESLDGTLNHELVHVVAAPFGLPVIRASSSPGLTEGLAMALTGDRGNRTLHQYAAALQSFGLAPDISRLLSPMGFFSQSSSVSYALAGSFCKFLIDRYGIRKIMQLYRSGDFSAQYGRSLETLMQEWRKYLERIPVSESDRDAIDAFFRHPPIFRKVCARVVAERNLTAGREFAAKNYRPAEALYWQSFQEAGSFEALGGYVASALRIGHYDGLTAVLDSIVMTDPRPARYLPLMLPLGDALWAQGKIDSASAVFNKIVAADLSDAFDEAALLRIAAIGDSALRRPFLSYILSDSADSVRIASLDSMTGQARPAALPAYLKGRFLLRKGDYAGSLQQLSSFTFQSTDRKLEGYRLRMAGEDLFRLKRFQEAKSSFWISLNFLDSGVAEREIGDWVERCDWIAEHGLP